LLHRLRGMSARPQPSSLMRVPCCDAIWNR
jgi:hypothetical protein